MKITTRGRYAVMAMVSLAAASRGNPVPIQTIAIRCQEIVSCFMPCTPNPTTGFFFYAPRSQVIELDITVEQAMTLIMSDTTAEAVSAIARQVEDLTRRFAEIAGAYKRIEVYYHRRRWVSYHGCARILR